MQHNKTITPVRNDSDCNHNFIFFIFKFAKLLLSFEKCKKIKEKYAFFGVNKKKVLYLHHNGANLN